jgi:hypothetical protein
MPHAFCNRHYILPGKSGRLLYARFDRPQIHETERCLPKHANRFVAVKNMAIS